VRNGDGCMQHFELLKLKLSIIQELSSAIALSDNINAIANLILDRATGYANAEKGSLMLLSDRNEFEIFAAKGLDVKFVRSYRIGFGEGIAGTVAKTRTAILVEDIEQEKDFQNLRRDHYRTRSFISCPIVSKNKLLGVLNINDKIDGSPFNVDEFELVKTLANHAAIALENALLVTQLKSKAAELEDLNKKMIEADILKTEFLTRISHELRTPLNSVKGAIYVLQQAEHLDSIERHEFQGIISSEIDNLVSIVENLLVFLKHEDGSRIVKKTVINMQDFFRDIQESNSLKTILARKGVSLFIETPDSMLEFVGDRIKGLQLFTNLIDGLAHYLERGDTMRIKATENEQLHVGITVSRALPEGIIPILYDTRYIFQLEHPEDQLKLYLAKNIAETNRWTLSAKNTDSNGHIMLSMQKNSKEAFETYVDRSMDSFVEFISELLGLDICSVMLSDDLTSELTVKSAVGLDDDIVKKTKIKLGDKIAGWVALEGKPLFIENIENDPRFSQKSISQYTTKSLMSLPLRRDDRVIGVLNLNNKKTSEPFTNQDYNIASVLSEKISHFIDILYSDTVQETEIQQFLASLNALFPQDTPNKVKHELLPELTDKILKNLKPLSKLKYDRALSRDIHLPPTS
jgi:GAF domain-containing protein